MLRRRACEAAIAIFVASFFASVSTVHANQSAFRGVGWYIRISSIVDVVFEGPFMTEGECLTVLKAKYPQLAKTAPDQTGEFMYCQRLTGPV